MNATLVSNAERFMLITGRALLGLYFIVPGLTKTFQFSATSTYMSEHGVPVAPALLVLTIILQVGGGISLLIGYRTQMAAFLLACLTLLINVFMHDFWNIYQGSDQAHETQNFIKNLAIMAGLLFVAGTREPAKSL